MATKSPQIPKVVPSGVPGSTKWARNVVIQLENLPEEVKTQLENYFVGIWGRKSITLTSADVDWKKKLRDSFGKFDRTAVGNEMFMDNEDEDEGGKKRPRVAIGDEKNPIKRPRVGDDDEEDSSDEDEDDKPVNPPQQIPGPPLANPGVVNIVPSATTTTTTTTTTKTPPTAMFSPPLLPTPSTATTSPPLLPTPSDIVQRMPATVVFRQQQGHPHPSVYSSSISVPLNMLPLEIFDSLISYATAPLRLYWLQTRIPYFRYTRNVISRVGETTTISTARRVKPIIDLSFTSAAHLRCHFAEQHRLFPAETSMHAMISRLFPETAPLEDTPVHITRVTYPVETDEDIMRRSYGYPVQRTDPTSVTTTTATSTSSTTTTTTSTLPVAPKITIDDVYATPVLNVSYSNMCMDLIHDILASRRRLRGIQRLLAQFTDIGGNFDIGSPEEVASNNMLTYIDVSNTAGSPGRLTGLGFWESVIRLPNLHVLHAHNCNWFTSLYTYLFDDCRKLQSLNLAVDPDDYDPFENVKIRRTRALGLIEKIYAMKTMPFPCLEVLDIENSLTIDFVYVILNTVLSKQLEMAGLRGRLIKFATPSVKSYIDSENAILSPQKSPSKTTTTTTASSSSSSTSTTSTPLPAIPLTEVTVATGGSLNYRFAGSSVKHFHSLTLIGEPPNFGGYSFNMNQVTTADCDVIGSAVPRYSEPSGVPELTDEQICQMGFINTLHELRTISRPYSSGHAIAEGNRIMTPEIGHGEGPWILFPDPLERGRNLPDPSAPLSATQTSCRFNSEFFAIHGITLMLQFVGDLARYSCSTQLLDKKNKLLGIITPSSSSSSSTTTPSLPSHTTTTTTTATTSTTTTVSPGPQPSKPRALPIHQRWGVTPLGTCPLRILTFGNYFPKQGDNEPDPYARYDADDATEKPLNPFIPVEGSYTENAYGDRYQPWIDTFVPEFRKLTNLSTLEFNVPIPDFPVGYLIPQSSKLTHLSASDIYIRRNPWLMRSALNVDELVKTILIPAESPIDNSAVANSVEALQLSLGKHVEYIGTLIIRCQNLRFLHLNGTGIARDICSTFAELLRNLPTSKITGLRLDVDTGLWTYSNEELQQRGMPWHPPASFGRKIVDYAEYASMFRTTFVRLGVIPRCDNITKFIFTHIGQTERVVKNAVEILQPIVPYFPNLRTFCVASNENPAAFPIESVFGLVNPLTVLQSLILSIRCGSTEVNWENVLSRINHLGIRTMRLSQIAMNNDQADDLFSALRDANFPHLRLVSLRDSTGIGSTWYNGLIDRLMKHYTTHSRIDPNRGTIFVNQDGSPYTFPFPLNCYVDLFNSVPRPRGPSELLARIKEKLGVTINTYNFPLYRGVRSYGFDVLDRIAEYAHMYNAEEFK